MAQLRLGKKTYQLPGSRVGRTIIGILLVIFGILGFLPVVGFWMIPLGLIVLSIDSPVIRRWRRRFEVWWFKKRHKNGVNGQDQGSGKS